ncbi:claudin-4-like [Osmerus mordax]|uniref:claudin-4-like n=1 Tax=Osmerus mordax TaxID=8014 RepID=UPI00350EAEE7
MVSLGTQMVASALSLLGWGLVIVTSVLPFWRVTAFVGSNIITAVIIWEGIWMTCASQSTGVVQCKPYDSMLALSSDLQAARALISFAIVIGAVGLLLAFVGGKCTRFLDEAAGKAKVKVSLAAGVTLAVTGLLCLIPTSWTAGTVVRQFYSVATDTERRELGACLYMGFGAAILLILGGGLFIFTSLPRKDDEEDKSPSVRYLVVRSSTGGSSQTASQRSRRAPTMSPTRGLMYKQPPWAVAPSVAGQEVPLGSWGSGGSKAPSTKSQMQRLGSSRSELSEVASTKSEQLKQVVSEESFAESAKSNLQESSDAGKTYI